MATSYPTSLSYPRFKVAVFALLTCNAAIYALGETPSSALDAFAWLMLLALFEWETEFSERLRAKSTVAAIHFTRIAAIGAVGAAAGAYVYEKAWLDVINTGLWIAVVVMLECEVRFPRIVAHRAVAFLTTAAALYAGLAIPVIVWAWRGEWFDAYDALLWIVAFATIEMDVLRFSQRSATSG